MIYGDVSQAIGKDPLGLNIYAPNIFAIRQSTNLYAYCGNNPVFFIDPSGLFVRRVWNAARDWVEDNSEIVVAGLVVAGAVVLAVCTKGAAAPLVAKASTSLVAVATTKTAVTVAAVGTSFGKLGTLVANNGKQVINWANTASYGLQRMAERGVTQNMANTWVRTGKAIQQSDGRILYVTQQGAAVVDKAGRLITTYTSKDFDANMVKVIKQLFGG
jgi:hypothetical protein